MGNAIDFSDFEDGKLADDVGDDLFCEACEITGWMVFVVMVAGGRVFELLERSGFEAPLFSCANERAKAFCWKDVVCSAE